ncbi:hypothetical protein [Nostoc sp.]|uniref:hypothetical protein n=1 Tax=Nostoc sp. TaxID=1180 RepID=UPI002FF462F4
MWWHLCTRVVRDYYWGNAQTLIISRLVRSLHRPHSAALHKSTHAPTTLDRSQHYSDSRYNKGDTCGGLRLRTKMLSKSENVSNGS